MKIINEIKKFIKRNISIIIIAIITLIVFLIIILFSSRQEDQKPYMIILDEEQKREIDFEREQIPQGTQEQIDLETEVLTQEQVNESRRNERDREIARNAADPKLVDEYYTEVEILYTNNGFEPRLETVFENQLVKITNTTNRTINIVQVIKRFSDFENGIQIAPNQSYNLRLYKTDIWTVEEESTKNRLYFFISDFKPY